MNIQSSKSIQYLLGFLSILLGILFICSAVSKVHPFYFFVNNIVDRFAITYSMGKLVAALIIGLEFTFGVFFSINIYGKKKWLLYLSLFILLIFTIYIFYLWYHDGARADCGCFGANNTLDVASSLLKNGIFIIINLLLLLYKNTKSRYNILTYILTPLIILATMVMLQPKLPIAKYFSEGNIPRGKQMVVFASVTCGHCIQAAETIGVLRKENKSYPIIFIFSKSPVTDMHLVEFLNANQIQDIPYKEIEKKSFMKLAGVGVPAIYILDDELIIDKPNHEQINKTYLDHNLK